MAEWPQVMMTCSECGNQLRRCSCRPADWYPEEPPVIKETVVPADLARELYEALVDVLQDYNPATVRVATQALARYEQEITE